MRQRLSLGRIRDRVQARLGGAVLRAPARVVGALAGPPQHVDGQRLDRRTQFAIAVMNRASPRPLEDRAVPDARREYEKMRAAFEDPPPNVAVADSGIPRAGPTPGELSIRVYGQAGATAGPGLVFYHGGGGVVGSLDTHDGICRQLAVHTGARIIAVDYRLAPEAPFPAAVDDAVAAFRFVRDRAAHWNLDPSRLAVGGDSMGANLAAVTALECRGDARGPCFQWLVYPVTRAGAQTRSRRLFGSGFLLSAPLIRWFEAHYRVDADPDDPRISPLLAPSLEGLPPALVVTAGFDPLRDEGRAYAERLEAAGVSTRYRCYEGLVHGFAQMTGAIEAATAAFGEIASDLKAALASPGG